ncbi:rhodanese-like domain-containing protein [Arthrobacter sp. C9C5]|uniref:rhodanese-like domain-containing protein n=1 Tax=Arthrobacter sp. C9C5 TaxID=2735267 RepID=UPI001585C586|nr:rhodanese-like domain-containing protein [Arthrobacter sp. C9C5]NUU31537.1 rhodanese-like domain-containing protein [Arthrobacter sp. C9C5]
MSYAGDLSPQEAWAKLEAGAILVDVRTEAEWSQIGVPVTAAATEERQDPLFVQWTLAGGAPNPHFLEQLQRQLRQQAPDATAAELVFLCRSGARSAAAANAATAAGFTAYNVLEGFEGEPGPTGARTVNGWKNRGLPTNQESTK